MGGKEGRESERTKVPNTFLTSCDMKTASHADSQYLPSLCLLSFVFLCPLWVFFCFLFTVLVSLSVILCAFAYLSSTSACQPLYICPFTCLQLHISAQHASKPHSKTYMKF